MDQIRRTGDHAGDVERARAIFELAISQPALDMPELLWKAYIDFEFEEGERERTRALYERLLEKSRHMKIWLAYAKFELAAMSNEDDEEEVDEEEDEDKKPNPARARAIYERAYKHFKAECARPEIKDDVEELRKVKTQRAELVLTAWKPFEEEHGSADEIERVNRINPHKELAWEPSEFGGMEEVWAWKFDDDIQEENPNAFKFLQMARAWKSAKNAVTSDSDSDDDMEDAQNEAKSGATAVDKAADNSDDDESD